VKRITMSMLFLIGTVGALTAPMAEAGIFNRNKDKDQRTEMPAWTQVPRRFDNMPTMSFHAGVLQQDGWNGWKLGELKLQLSPDCVIATDGQDVGYLDAGRTAIVMGSRQGDTIVAWSVRVKKPEYLVGRANNPNLQLKVSDTNSHCAELVSGPQ